jgi:hypothetical protein
MGFPKVKKLRKILSTVVLLPLFFGCSSQDQDITNEATRYFSVLAQTLVQFFQNDLTTCSQFQSIYDELSTDFFNCDNGDIGQFNLIKVSVSCTDGSPLIATADFVIEFADCEDSDNDVTTTGPISFSLNFTRTENFVLVSSTSVNINGLNFVFDNLNVEINFSNGNVNCDGDLTVDGEQCSVDDDCEGCG